MWGLCGSFHHLEGAQTEWVYDEEGTASPQKNLDSTDVIQQLTRDALERSNAKRAAYRYEYGLKFTPEQTVFVDESSFDRRTSIRGRAWALSGERAVRKCFFVRGKRYSLLPALSSEGMIWVKIVEGSFTSERFREFIEGLLDRMQPFPAPNSVIVMDNARIHKDPEILDLIEQRCVFVFVGAALNLFRLLIVAQGNALFIPPAILPGLQPY